MKVAIILCLLGVFLGASAHYYGGYGGATFNTDMRNSGGFHQNVNDFGGVIQDKFGHSIRGPGGFGGANTDIGNRGGYHQNVNRIGGILTV